MKSPAIRKEVQKDQVYYWCSCGNTKKEPFCDKVSQCGVKAVMFTSHVNTMISFCTCKKSQHGAICDSSHRKYQSKDNKQDKEEGDNPD